MAGSLVIAAVFGVARAMTVRVWRQDSAARLEAAGPLPLNEAA